jgi:hypothetical protein
MFINSVDKHPLLFLESLMLSKKLESTLLRNISRLLQLLQSLQTSRMLLLGNNTSLSGLHQILLGQTTGSMLGSSVENLRLRASCDHSATILLILTSYVSAVAVHFYNYTLEIKT